MKIATMTARGHDVVMVDELDIKLINAIQLTPRISWSDLAPILKTDTSTLSRRWAKLKAEGLAWTTCYVLTQRIKRSDSYYQPWSALLAYVEVRCVAAQREKIIQAASQEEAIINVECTSGSRDLGMTIAAGQAAEIDAFVAAHIATLPGVLSTNTHYGYRVFKDGSDFELGTLSEDERSAVISKRPQTSPRGMTKASPMTDAVVQALQDDLRRPASSIAEELGISVAGASRAITRVLSHDWVRVRGDFAHDVLGWGVSVIIWLNVRQPQLEAVAAMLSALPQVRLCSAQIGPSNLNAVLWMKDVRELNDVEGALSTAFPDVRITDRWVTSRTAKRMGVTFNDVGRRNGYVPVPVTM